MSTSRDQLNRLLALVPYLQGRGEISVTEAAHEFGVTERTIRRDIGVLMFCGLPGLGMGDLIEVDFEALEDRDVIRLSNADYLSRPLRLDSNEAAALVVGLRALLEGSSAEEREVVGRALAKIERAAGEAAGVAVHLDLRVTDGPEVEVLRRRLSDAVAAGRQVRLTHRSAVRDELTTRVVEPIALSTAGGHAYLDAWCRTVQDRRLFRLDRVVEMELLEEPVSDHARVTPLDLSQGIFRAAPDALLATLRLDRAARWVAEYHPVEESVEEPDGGLTVRLRVVDPVWLVRLMLRLGGSAALVEPEQLAAEVRRTARAALEHYAQNGTGDP